VPTSPVKVCANGIEQHIEVIRFEKKVFAVVRPFKEIHSADLR